MLPARNKHHRRTTEADALDLELSALVYLLARCAQCPGNQEQTRLALHHLERVACRPDVSPLLRETTSRILAWWRAGDAVPGCASPLTH